MDHGVRQEVAITLPVARPGQGKRTTDRLAIAGHTTLFGRSSALRFVLVDPWTLWESRPTADHSGPGVSRAVAKVNFSCISASGNMMIAMPDTKRERKGSRWSIKSEVSVFIDKGGRCRSSSSFHFGRGLPRNAKIWGWLLPSQTARGQNREMAGSAIRVAIICYAVSVIYAKRTCKASFCANNAIALSLFWLEHDCYCSYRRICWCLSYLLTSRGHWPMRCPS